MIEIHPHDRALLAKIGQRLLGNPPTLEWTLRLCLEAVNNDIRGDFVECGVFAGCHPAIMMYVNKQEWTTPTRAVHLFDSFQGIPRAGPRDDHTITELIGDVKDGALVSTGHSVCSVEQVEAHLKEWGMWLEGCLRFHVGWFQSTVPLAADGELKLRGIAVLRLDGDLYESTKVCLEHLYPLVRSGGFVIIDDYALHGCKAAVDEYLDGRFSGALEVIEGGDGPVWFRKP